MISEVLPSSPFILLAMIPSLTKQFPPHPFYFDLYGKEKIDIHQHENGHQERKDQS